MDSFAPGSIETGLLETVVGYDVLDAIAQANMDINSIPQEELRRMVEQFTSKRSLQNGVTLSN